MHALIPTVLLLSFQAFIYAAYATTWHILPDGTGDAPTIQAAVDSAVLGDTVEVACGEYFDCSHPAPDGELACVILKPGVYLISESGDPTCASINAQQLGRVLYCEGVGSDVLIEGFTITGGHLTIGWPDGQGAGVFCRDGSSPTIRNCRFNDNWTSFDGGAISCCWNSSPQITGVVFENNSASHSAGGVICCHTSHPSIVDCEFVGNTAIHGGAMHIGSGSSPSLERILFLGNSGSEAAGIVCNSSTPSFLNCTFSENQGHAIAAVNGATIILEECIIAFSTGKAMDCVAGGTASFSCSDLWGNAAGDWTGCVAGQNGSNGNFSADPLFCDASVGDFTLHETSPCAPGNHPDGFGCDLIGTLGIGCGPTVSVEKTGWGALKAIFK